MDLLTTGSQNVLGKALLMTARNGFFLLSCAKNSLDLVLTAPFLQEAESESKEVTALVKKQSRSSHKSLLPKGHISFTTRVIPAHIFQRSNSVRGGIKSSLETAFPKAADLGCRRQAWPELEHSSTNGGCMREKEKKRRRNKTEKKPPSSFCSERESLPISYRSCYLPA